MGNQSSVRYGPYHYYSFNKEYYEKYKDRQIKLDEKRKKNEIILQKEHQYLIANAEELLSKAQKSALDEPVEQEPELVAFSKCTVCKVNDSLRQHISKKVEKHGYRCSEISRYNKAVMMAPADNNYRLTFVKIYDLPIE